LLLLGAGGAELSVSDNPVEAVLAGRPEHLWWPHVFEGLQPGLYAVEYLGYGSAPDEPFRVIRTVPCCVRSGEQTDLFEPPCCRRETKRRRGGP